MVWPPQTHGDVRLRLEALELQLADAQQVAVSPDLADLPVGGILVQTGLGDDGSGFTVWFDDGTGP